MSSNAFTSDLRVMIVTDVRLYREGLSSVLAGQPGLDVVGHSSPGDATLGGMAMVKPHVVLIDSGLVIRTDVCRRVATLAADIRVIAFAVEEDNDHEVLACAKAGVVGFVAREASAEDLVRAILTARTGLATCSPRATAALIRSVATLSTDQPLRSEPTGLTPREYQILSRVDAGLSNKEIANQLGIAVVTVKNHIHNILAKLSVHRRGEAAAFVRSLRMPSTLQQRASGQI